MNSVHVQQEELSLEDWFCENSHAQIAVLLCFHVLLWGSAGWALGYPGGVTDDMLETYTWGRELEWGYYKHPPFYAWVANVWFECFPTSNWSYYFLSSVNGAVGLFGLWLIAGRYVTSWNRISAVLLLDLMPLYTLQSFNFNANSISLAIWPWAIFSFLRSYEDKNLLWSIGLGAIGAAAILSKYYAGTLLFSFVFASFASRQWKDYYSSLLPYIVVVVFVICILPHVIWLLEATTTPLNYLSGKETEFARALGKAAKVFVSGIAFHLFVAGVLILFQRRLQGSGKKAINIFWQNEHSRTLLILAVLPFLVTVALGVILSLKLSSRFIIPAFALSPLVLIVVFQVKFDGIVTKRIAGMALVFSVLCILVAPLNGYFRIRQSAATEHSDPRVQLAEFIEHSWQSWTEKPMEIIAGTQSYSLATSYYTKAHPAHFTEFRYDYAPWVNEVGLRRSGLAVICISSDTDCLKSASGLKRFYPGGRHRADRFSFANSVLGVDGERINFMSFFYLPEL